MGIETEHREEIEKEPMEQSPAIVKGKEIPIYRRDSFYYLEGSNEAFTSRHYAEQAYRERLVAKEKPKMAVIEKRAEKAAALGLISKKDLKKVKDEQREWLEKQ